MDEANTAKEKAKVLTDDLRAEKQLSLEKDEQLLAAKERVETIAAKRGGGVALGWWRCLMVV